MVKRYKRKTAERLASKKNARTSVEDDILRDASTALKSLSSVTASIADDADEKFFASIFIQNFERAHKADH